jgi:serine phosphatase RsbU (regulator of sigma subunit)
LNLATTDYLDVQPLEDGCWIGIGDVAGHGLTAGMLMIMLHSVVAGLIKSSPRSSPADLVRTVNAVLFENVRDRLELDHHPTLMLLRYDRRGVVEYAGVHDDIVRWRARDRTCQPLTATGHWRGLGPSADGCEVASQLEVEAGDILVVYTDGITERHDAHGGQYGVRGLCDAVSAASILPAAQILDHVWASIGRFQESPKGDATLAVFRVTA